MKQLLVIVVCLGFSLACGIEKEKSAESVLESRHNSKIEKIGDRYRVTCLDGSGSVAIKDHIRDAKVFCDLPMVGQLFSGNTSCSGTDITSVFRVGGCEQLDRANVVKQSSVLMRKDGELVCTALPANRNKRDLCFVAKAKAGIPVMFNDNTSCDRSAVAELNINTQCRAFSTSDTSQFMKASIGGVCSAFPGGAASSQSLCYFGKAQTGLLTLYRGLNCTIGGFATIQNPWDCSGLNSSPSFWQGSYSLNGVCHNVSQNLTEQSLCQTASAGLGL